MIPLLNKRLVLHALHFGSLPLPVFVIGRRRRSRRVAAHTVRHDRLALRAGADAALALGRATDADGAAASAAESAAAAWDGVLL